MDPGLKQRLIGAAVLVAIAVIFLPMLVQGPAPDSGVSDVPLDMPGMPGGQYETRDLPLVTPGEAPDGGALGMQAGEAGRGPPAVEVIAEDDARADLAGPAPSQPQPLEDAPASTPTPLPASVPSPAVAKLPPVATPPAVATPAKARAEPMLPATTAGGDYAVNFGAYATAANAETILRQLRASQLAGYSERTTINGSPAWRVRIGPYATRADAEAARLRAGRVRDDVTARVVTLDAAVAPAKPSPPTVAPAPRQVAPVAPVAPAAPVAGTAFAVQVGAFGNAADATVLRDRLRGAGFAAFTETVETDKGRLTRVRVGPVGDRAAAEQLRAQVQSATSIAGIVRPHP